MFESELINKVEEGKVYKREIFRRICLETSLSSLF